MSRRADACELAGRRPEMGAGPVGNKGARLRRRLPGCVASALVVLSLGLVACSGNEKAKPTASTASRPSKSAVASGPPGSFKVGRPYQINGRWYYPEYDPNYRREGTASWYGAQFHGLTTANGEIFDKDEISAASPTLPLPSMIRVTNLDNGRELMVRVNDRGPFVEDRLIDLSQAAARELGYEQRGLARVRVELMHAGDAGGGPPPPTAYAAATPAPEGAAAPTTVAAIARTPLDPISPARGDVVRTEVVSIDPSGDEPDRITAVTTVDEPRSPSRPRPVMVASLEAAPSIAGPPPLPPRTCYAGAQYVQVGAFGDTQRVRLATVRLAGLDAVRTEPVFVNGQAVMRVRLGPVSDAARAWRLLDQAKARGYGEARIVPAVAGMPPVRC